MFCPYCNSSLANLSTPRCPRCDERLPESMIANLPIGAVPSAAIASEPIPPGKAATLKFILGAMACMAAIAFVFILSTKTFRRDNDFKKGYAKAAPTSRIPGDLPVLGLVPARCNFLAGVSLADLRQDPEAAKAFFQNPSLVPMAEVVNDLTGLRLEDLDQIAVGAEMTDKLPKVYLIAETRTKYDANNVLKKATSKQMLRSRPVAKFPLPKIGEAVVWCMDDRHIAVLLRIEPGNLDDLQSIPPLPRRNLEGSPDYVRSLVNDRLSRQSLAWAVGDLASAVGLRDLLAFVPRRIDGLPTLLDARGFAVSLTLTAEREWQIFAQVEAFSPKNSGELEKLFGAFDWGGPKSLKVDASAPPWIQTQVRYELRVKP